MEYEALKVTELKALLKERQIPITGLTKKVQYIQALVDGDNAAQEETAEAQIQPEEQTKSSAKLHAESGSYAVDNHAPEQNAPESLTATPATQQDAITSELNETALAHGIAAEQPATITSEPQLTNETTPATEHKRKRQEEDDYDEEHEIPKRSRIGESNHEEHELSEKSKVDNEDITHGGQVAAEVVEQSKDIAEPISEEQTTTTPQVKDDLHPEPQSEHPPTSALYIRNLMRPLQAPAFRADLAALADSTTADQNSIVVDLHLDNMKTHAFVVCGSAQIANKLRTALHGRPWPQHESQRKSVWVDFIPEDRVQDWINEESRAPRDARFEVVYHRDDHTGQPMARLSELNARLQPNKQPPAPGQGMPGAPSGPRGHRGQTQGEPIANLREEARTSTAPAAPKQSSSFNKLDSYFHSTTARPKIYYEPVDEQLARNRLKNLDRGTSRDWQGGKSWNRTSSLAPMDQLRRYTFDDGDKVVDGGPDIGGFGRPQGAGAGSTFSSGPRGGGDGGQRRYRQ